MIFRLYFHSKVLYVPVRAFLRKKVSKMTTIFFSVIRWTFFDPRGLPTVTVGSDHYFLHLVYVRPSLFSILAKQNKFQARIVIASGEPVGLAKGIIDDTHFFSFLQVQR